METVLYQYKDLKAFCEEAFIRFGFSEGDSEIITDVLLKADLYGIDSHGTNRIVLYHEQIRNGFIDVTARPQIVLETPVSCVIDGHQAMGQLVSVYAMEQAIARAGISGVGLVTVRNSNHYGIAGYYSRMAERVGFIGVAMTNSLKAVVPTFGRLPMLGTNPIALTVPSDQTPFHFDGSTSVVTAGKIEVRSKLGESIPAGWAMNGQGLDEEDPAVVLDHMTQGLSGLHPLGGGTETLGGHKGYGFSMMAEIFSSILSQGTTSNHVEEGDRAGVCHFFAAIDPSIFGDADAIRHHLETYLNEIRESPKASGADRIYIHGEKEEEAYGIRLREGIRINARTLEEMKAVAEDLGMDFGQYFPRI